MLFLVLLFGFFHSRSFFTLLTASISHFFSPPPKNFRNLSPLLFISHASSFSDIHISVDIKILVGFSRKDGRTDGHVITKISLMYRLPFFLAHVASLQALCARESSISLTAECER